MFGKLKDKLKSTLSIFSRKAKEEAEDIPQEEVDQLIEEGKIEEEDIVEEVKEEVKEKEPEPTEEVKEEEPAEKEVVEETKKIPELPIEKEEEVKEPVEEVKEEKTTEDLVKETKEKFKEEVKDKKEEKIPSSEELIEATKKFSEEKKKEEELQKEEKKKEQINQSEKIIEEDITKEEKEPQVEIVEEQVKEEKKGFFGRFFSKKDEKDSISEKDKKEELDQKEIPKEETKEKDKEKKSIFSKVKQSLTTKTISVDKFEELFWDLELVLLENNVSVEVIEKIKEDLKEELVDKPLPRDVSKKIEETLRNTLSEILSYEDPQILERIKVKEGPFVMAFFGINGVGKTTSIAKLTHYLKKNKISVVLAACDTFRAAAIDQLGEHADKLDVKMIKHDYGSDAAAVAFDAIKYAEKNNVDVVMVDTAGRLHSNTNLMAELEKIIRVANPDLKIFVGESITGNDCIEQARKFNELVEMDGAILTKADVDEKGGAPLSISYTIKKPILFLGVGQEYKDIEKFDKAVILQRLGF